MTKTFDDRIRTLEIFESSDEGLESNDPMSPKYKKKENPRFTEEQLARIESEYLMRYPNKTIGIALGTITPEDMFRSLSQIEQISILGKMNVVEQYLQIYPHKWKGVEITGTITLEDMERALERGN